VHLFQYHLGLVQVVQVKALNGIDIYLPKGPFHAFIDKVNSVSQSELLSMPTVEQCI
jgi:hypothetical protein